MTRTSWTIAVALAAAVSACSGGGGDEGGQTCTVAPIAITQGTWCITITGTTNSCGSSVVPPPYTATFTQSGSILTATSQGATYTGSMCGTTGVMSGTTNTATVMVHVEFSDPSHATGTSDWTTTGCGGTDTFTAHAGGCP